ncbi:amino acid/amide ABC transporter substrate-binding protein (HAAT family) [Pseudacidovorax intermedius]|uniref:Amino acid/amide ABC transporter substrate-binding protein (HAAT family) n=1 Tax=Pseudacidovorax intermedius TaxID=433924 RepID=A0A370FDY4_9BURK|nr:ABC transporter substrate-binding protein [Pseudacidovorax intermedius]RDI22012.1 amino acid/amide ABC transporter substrate-binding protein (HAAT family) [Pseudacidovorax intermedius]
MNRREILMQMAGLGALAMSASPSWAADDDIVVGAIYPMSGPNAQVGVDARHAIDTALQIINTPTQVDLPGAAGSGIASLGGRKLRVVYADHQADPQKGRAEAERLITQEKAVAIIGCFHSSVAATVSTTCERYGVPFVCADSSSPSLHRRNLKTFFRPAAHDEMFSEAMFDFMDLQKKQGKKVETVALFFEDTIFGTDSSTVQRKLAAERGYKVAADVKFRANSPSLSAEVQQLKSANADVLLPSCYTTDVILLMNTCTQLGYKPRNIVAQAAGFVEKAALDVVGDKLQGMITRASFALDTAGKRPSIGFVNTAFKARAGRDLNDASSRQFMAAIVLGDALQRAGSTDSEKLRAALAATDIPGDKTIMPWSRVKFDASGQNTFASPVLQQFKGTGFVTVFPTAVAMGQPVWPMNG